jgi:hypothetical protein
MGAVGVVVGVSVSDAGQHLRGLELVVGERIGG